MQDNIYDIIEDFSKRGKGINKPRVKKIISLLVEEFDLKDYYKDIGFNDKIEGTSYNPFDRKIVFNFDYHNHDIDPYVKNYLELYELVHEVTHARQLKFINENNYNDLSDPFDMYRYRLTNEFFRYCKFRASGVYNFVPSQDDVEFIKNICKCYDETYTYTFNFLYHLLHNSFICEREADIEGFKYVIDMLKKNSPNSIIIQFFENQLRKKYLYLYGFKYGEPSYTPLQDYLEHFGYYEITGELTALKDEINRLHPDMSAETRMEYGLDVDYDKYKEMNEYVYNERFKRRLLEHRKNRVEE